MQAYASRLFLQARALVLSGALIGKNLQAEEWNVLKGALLAVLLVGTAFNVLVALNHVEFRAVPASVVLPRQPLPPAQAASASQGAAPVYYEWAAESAIHSGDVPGYTTVPRNKVIDRTEVNTESGQAMTGVIFP